MKEMKLLVMKKLLIVIMAVMAGLFCQAQTTQQADSLHQRGKELLENGKIAEGRECTRQAMEIRKKLLGEVNEDYITSLNNYAMTFGLEQEGFTKREALVKAQQEIRNKGFKDPKYWAAFILLDAL